MRNFITLIVMFFILSSSLNLSLRIKKEQKNLSKNEKGKELENHKSNISSETNAISSTCGKNSINCVPEPIISNQ